MTSAFDVQTYSFRNISSQRGEIVVGLAPSAHFDELTEEKGVVTFEAGSTVRNRIRYYWTLKFKVWADSHPRDFIENSLIVGIDVINGNRTVVSDYSGFFAIQKNILAQLDTWVALTGLE